jgi:hypothetical protein
MVGQKLTVEVVKRGDAGIKFLARIYGPDVWFGDTSSCCDVLRQIAKFHTTIALHPGVTAVDKLCEKAYAYYLSDRNTPILGEIANAVVTLGYRKPAVEHLHIYGADLPEEVQYPNEPRDWYMDVVRQQMPTFDHERFRNWLRNSQSIDALLMPPLCMEIIPAKSDVSAIVDGQLIGSIKTRRPQTPKSGQKPIPAEFVARTPSDPRDRTLPRNSRAPQRSRDQQHRPTSRPSPWLDATVKGPSKPWVRAAK